VVTSLAAAVLLLASFVLIEARSRHALMPLRIFRNRNRSGALLVMLCVGTAMFGMFFFLSLFVQQVWGYSALKAGVAYLPMVGMIMLMAGVSSQLVPRIGARPLLLAGSGIAAGGMFWLSRITEHSTYTSGLLGPMMVTAAGLGMLFMPLTLVALSRVENRDAGLASSLLNTAQQVGGSIGLALLGTVAWTVVANSIRSQVTAGAAAAARTGHPVHAAAGHLPTAIYDHALAVGFSRGFLVSAGIALLGLVISALMIRVTRADLAGAQQAMTAAPTVPAVEPVEARS
jgi:predicted MFS family arabinose efflux permease